MTAGPLHVFVVGAGRAGRALALLVQHSGHELAGVSNFSEQGAARTHALLGLTAQVGPCPTLPPACDVAWLCVPDRAIGAAAQALEASGQLDGRVALLHASGSVPARVLAEAAPSAAGAAGLHPLFPFDAPHASATGVLRASWFVEGDPRGVQTAARLLAPLGITPHPLAPEDRALYHAAAVVASNALVALLGAARDLLGLTGLDDRAAVEALLPLVHGTLRNVHASGVEAALTGPIARGDAEVVSAHLTALATRAPALLPLYRALATATLHTARRGHRLSEQAATAVERALEDAPAPATEDMSQGPVQK